MNLSRQVLHTNDDLPIKAAEPVHKGKVRAVYGLSPTDSRRLLETHGYAVPADASLAIMVISDRISAFDCIWHAEDGLLGVPGKGAALNAISHHWFDRMRQHGLAGNHIVDVPHPLVWIVRRAQPIRIEAIVRQYLTGSLWRAYQRGARSICGIPLPDGLQAHQRLEAPLVTPSTKGIVRGIAEVPEADDVDVARDTILAHLDTFGFATAADVDRYERMVLEGFALIADEVSTIGQIFVDTKFELGYVQEPDGERTMIFIDEVGTPDSSRLWDAQAYAEGRIVENSKEGFRQMLLRTVPDADVLLNKQRMAEREELARTTALPAEAFRAVSQVYVGMAETITGKPLGVSDRPREEILDILNNRYRLIG